MKNWNEGERTADLVGRGAEEDESTQTAIYGIRRDGGKGTVARGR